MCLRDDPGPRDADAPAARDPQVGGPKDDEHGARLILVEVAEGPVALLVDEVHEVLTIPREAYQPVHTPGDTDALAYLCGAARIETGFVLWVDHHHLVPFGVVKKAVKKAA